MFSWSPFQNIHHGYWTHKIFNQETVFTRTINFVGAGQKIYDFLECSYWVYIQDKLIKMLQDCHRNQTKEIRGWSMSKVPSLIRESLTHRMISLWEGKPDRFVHCEALLRFWIVIKILIIGRELFRNSGHSFSHITWFVLIFLHGLVNIYWVKSF